GEELAMGLAFAEADLQHGPPLLVVERRGPLEPALLEHDPLPHLPVRPVEARGAVGLAPAPPGLPGHAARLVIGGGHSLQPALVVLEGALAHPALLVPYRAFPGHG